MDFSTRNPNTPNTRECFSLKLVYAFIKKPSYPKSIKHQYNYQCTPILYCINTVIFLFIIIIFFLFNTVSRCTRAVVRLLLSLLFYFPLPSPQSSVVPRLFDRSNVKTRHSTVRAQINKHNNRTFVGRDYRSKPNLSHPHAA